MEKLTKIITNSNQSHEFSTLKTSPRSKGLAAEVLPIFKFLRILGRCPLLFETRTDSEGLERVTFNFRFCWDVKFILSTVVAILVPLCCILEMMHYSAYTASVFGELWPVENQDEKLAMAWNQVDPLARSIMKSYPVVFAIMSIVEYVIAWLTSPTLAKWLNDWHEIDDDLQLHFDKPTKSNVSKLLNYFAIPYITIPTITFGTAIALSNIEARSVIGVFIRVVCAYITTACFQAEDAKVVLMFKTVEMGFKKVREGIKIRLHRRDSSDPMTTLESKDVKGWQRTLIKIRKQAKIVGNHLAVQQLFSMGMLIYFASSAIFLIPNIFGYQNQDGNQHKSIFTLIIFVLLSHTRLYIKIFMAVRIGEEEKKLSYLLKDSELVEDDIDCKQEMKDIHELLNHCPTEISLNNYVKLNNALMLTIVGQVLTHFIVLQQFHNSTA